MTKSIEQFQYDFNNFTHNQSFRSQLVSPLFEGQRLGFPLSITLSSSQCNTSNRKWTGDGELDQKGNIFNRPFDKLLISSPF